MSLRLAYSIIAPFYDWIVDLPSRQFRKVSFAQAQTDNKDILILGIGTGLDIPHLSPATSYTGIDITPAMLKKAQKRAHKHQVDIRLIEDDVQNLSLPDAGFDLVFMHLILAVVPNSQAALNEAYRMLKPGGQVIIVDKFLRAGRLSPIRRLLSPITALFATKLNVVFEDLLAESPFKLIDDQDVLAGGWIRRIILKKPA